MKAKATVGLLFHSEKQLKSLQDALTPEINRQVGVRSKAELKADGLVLVLDVEADDTGALRAALNAYLRWINSAMNVIEAVERN